MLKLSSVRNQIMNFFSKLKCRFAQKFKVVLDKDKIHLPKDLFKK